MHLSFRFSAVSCNSLLFSRRRMKSSVAWELNSDKEVKSARKDKGKEVGIFNIDANYNIGYRKSCPSQVTVSQNQVTASLSYVSCLSCLYSLLSFFSFCQASPFHISCTSCLNSLSSLTCLSYLYFFFSLSWSQIMEVIHMFLRVMSALLEVMSLVPEEIMNIVALHWSQYFYLPNILLPFWFTVCLPFVCLSFIYFVSTSYEGLG